MGAINQLSVMRGKFDAVDDALRRWLGNGVTGALQKLRMYANHQHATS